MQPNRLFITTLCFILIYTIARGEDWPQWRGVNRDAVWNEAGIVEQFPADGLKIRWTAPVGFGYSSPVVAQGRVFVTDALLMEPVAKERVLCFDEVTGQQLWQYAYDPGYPGWAFTPANEGRPTSTPVVDAGKVYAIGRNGHLHCFDLQGTLLWSKDLAKEYSVEEFACQTSPLIDGNLLIVAVGGIPNACVIAFDKNSGHEVWKAIDEMVTNSSPIIIEFGGKRQLIIWTQLSVSSLEPATGQLIWRYRAGSSSAGAIATPVFLGNRLLVDGLMLELNDNLTAPSRLWPNTNAESKRAMCNTSTPLLRDGFVYSATSGGPFVCLKADTGEKVWETTQITDPKSGSSVHITPHGDFVFLYTDRGELILAKIAPDGYHEISRSRVIEPTYPFGGRNVAWPPPAYANGHIFARSDKELVCASLSTP